jgi:heme oxygenase
VFKQQMPKDLWADFTYQKSLIYNGIEGVAGACGLLKDLPDIQRAHYLYLDYKEMIENKTNVTYRQVAIDYYKYILSLFPDEDRIAAHLYVWHMGDLFGGQMIKKIVDAPSRALTFKDPEQLKVTIRTKLKDTMADEANVAFDWAIKLLNDYELSSME